MLLVLLLSDLIWLGWLPDAILAKIQCGQGSGLVRHQECGGIQAVHHPWLPDGLHRLFVDAGCPTRRIPTAALDLAALALLAAGNVLVMVIGRTGYVVSGYSAFTSSPAVSAGAAWPSPSWFCVVGAAAYQWFPGIPRAGEQSRRRGRVMAAGQRRQIFHRLALRLLHERAGDHQRAIPCWVSALAGSPRL